MDYWDNSPHSRTRAHCQCTAPPTATLLPVSRELTRCTGMVVGEFAGRHYFSSMASLTRLRNLQRSWRENGLAPPCHGNARRLPANILTFADMQMIVSSCRHTPRPMQFFLAGFQGTSTLMCNCFPPVPPNNECGSSTAHPYSLSPLHTIRQHTPRFTVSGDVWHLMWL